ncbi:hypothetical protein MMC31_001513 [Peltigera leucophlebia]|nr:hypothetical protein [Peltigera leucophlebia]
MGAPSDAMVEAQASEPEWTEDKLVSSLARLKEMHIQLRHLRGTIPRMMGPLREQHPSPEQFYSNFAKATTRAHEDMIAFQNLMQDPRNQAILDQAKKSRRENPDGITVWRVTDHPNWLDVREEASLKHSPNEPEEGNDDRNAVKEEDYRAALKKFEENHPTLKASIQDEGSNIIQIQLPPPSNLNFIIEPKPTSQNPTTYTITTPEKSKINTALLNEIANRPKSTNLTYLLEMLASYTNLRSSPCVKCKRLMDRNAQFPTVRTRVRTKTADSQHVYQWQAFHKGCV